jgi:adenylylsulfate kinase-like enzyme
MVIVITGPIASGKSTIARGLARELGRRHIRAAIIDLDILNEMLETDGSESGDAGWALARRAAAALANTFLEIGVAVVVDGSFNRPGHRDDFAEHLDARVDPLYVTLRVSYEEALRRAQGDPTRGMSRDPAFLGPYFTSVGHGLETVPVTDIVIDTEQMSATSAVMAIARIIGPGTSG